MLKYQNIKIFSQIVYPPNWSEKVFMTKKIKDTVPWTMLLMILMVRKLLELFMKKNCKKQIKRV